MIFMNFEKFHCVNYCMISSSVNPLQLVAIILSYMRTLKPSSLKSLNRYTFKCGNAYNDLSYRTETNVERFCISSLFKMLQSFVCCIHV